MEVAPKDFFRLTLGGEVRLRYGFVIKCLRAEKDAAGTVTTLYCSYDPETLNRKPEGRKVKGVIHWLAAANALPMQVNLYERLYTTPTPEGEDGSHEINPQSLTVAQGFAEAPLAQAAAGTSFQFERLGYFCCDKTTSPAKAVVNRSVTLRDSWSKE
jgi:glutaminyl-tRNA synthetase